MLHRCRVSGKVGILAVGFAIGGKIDSPVRVVTACTIPAVDF
jgi:hypothetical protein